MSKRNYPWFFIILALIAVVLTMVVTIERWPQYTAQPEYDPIVAEKLTDFHSKII